MADNKNQHYVPKVYLKPFTLDGEGRSINLFNIDRMKSVRHAPVKNQCSGDYFYGDDDRLERAINSIENPYGEVVRHLSVDTNSVNAKAQITLKRFVYLQHLRTEAASRKMAEMTAAIQNLPDFDIRDEMKTAVQLAMRQFADSIGIVDDLKVCIVRIHTARPFVTSDDPAVLTNRLHLQRRHRVILRSFGVGTAGAMFLLPLSPRLCAVVYDSAVYRTTQQAGWINLVQVKDVDAVNEHQILNCMANVYFREWDRRGEVAQQVSDRRDSRPERRHTVVHAVLDYTTEWRSRYAVKKIKDIRDEEEILIHIKTNHPEPSAWPSFLQFRPDAKAYSNGTGAGLTRRWCLDQGYATGRNYKRVRV